MANESWSFIHENPIWDKDLTTCVAMSSNGVGGRFRFDLNELEFTPKILDISTKGDDF